jgi:hypothetical protein
MPCLRSYQMLRQPSSGPPRTPKLILELTDLLTCEKMRPSAMRPHNRVFESLDDAMAAVYRNKTPGERLRVAFGLWTSTRILLKGILRAQHPDWDDQRIRAEVARRMSHGAV